MNRSKVYARRFDVLGIERIDFEKKPCVETPDKNKQLLDLIFASDSDGVISGDIFAYMSEKTNPQIRQFIQENLLYEHSSERGLQMSTEQSNARMSMSDDDIAIYSRDDGESVEEYANRLHSMFSEQRRQAYFKRRYEALKNKFESKTD